MCLGPPARDNELRSPSGVRRLDRPTAERSAMTSSSSRHPDTIRTLSENECLSLLSTTTVGRVAFSSVEGPELVPVNFVLIDRTIYFRTLPDGFLSQLSRGNDGVAFGIDFHDDTSLEGWNVTIKGPASQVEDRATINLVLGHSQLRPWAGGVRPLMIRIEIRSISGRRVSGH